MNKTLIAASLTLAVSTAWAPSVLAEPARTGPAVVGKPSQDGPRLRLLLPAIQTLREAAGSSPPPPPPPPPPANGQVADDGFDELANAADAPSEARPAPAKPPQRGKPVNRRVEVKLSR